MTAPIIVFGTEVPASDHRALSLMGADGDDIAIRVHPVKKGEGELWTRAAEGLAIRTENTERAYSIARAGIIARLRRAEWAAFARQTDAEVTR